MKKKNNTHTKVRLHTTHSCQWIEWCVWIQWKCNIYIFFVGSLFFTIHSKELNHISKVMHSVVVYENPSDYVYVICHSLAKIHHKSDAPFIYIGTQIFANWCYLPAVLCLHSCLLNTNKKCERESEHNPLDISPSQLFYTRRLCYRWTNWR